MANLRVPPHSLEAETSVLGAILISKEGITKVAEFLRPEHFYDPAHQSIFQAILELYEHREPLDIVTLAEQLKKSRKLSAAGGSEMLAGLVDSVPTASHIEHYGRLVKDNWLKRQLIETAAAANELAFNQSRPTGEIFDEVEQKIFALSQQEDRRGFISVKDALAESFDRLDELQRTQTGLRGVPSGFKDLDNALAGMQPSNLLILAARPGLGKTSLALNISQYAAVTAGIPVGYFALEMSQEEMVDRMLIAQADVDAWKFKTGRFSEADFNRLSEAFGILAEAPMFIDDTPALSIMQMRTKARRLKAEHNVGLLIVDYLQLARSRNLENRVQEVSEISQGLKNLARELKVPILALSQLSRAVEHRGHSRPQLADLRECLAGDTLITMADTGELRQIKNLVGKSGFKVFSLGADNKLTVSKVKAAIASGQKKIYSLSTQSGRIIRCSKNHPFYTLQGWQKLEKITEGEYIATARDLPVNPKIRPKLLDTEAKIRLLGHMLGDGSFIPRRILQYTSVNPQNLKQVTGDAENSFAVNTRIVKERNWYQAYFTSVRRVSKNYRNPMVRWLDDLGIWGLRSPQRFIPGGVFLLPLDDIKLFLRHLWATDGCVWINKNQTRVKIYYASASKTLADNVRSLLLRCGILSNIHVNRKKGFGNGYHVCVDSREMQTKFSQEIGGFADKFDQIEKAKLILAKIKPNPNLDVIPKPVWQIIDRARQARKITWRKFAKLLKMSYCGSSLFKSGISRDRMRRIVAFLNDPEIRNLADSGIYWDKIISVRPEAVEDVYDLQVKGSHNFAANDIFVHNSGAIEQDADVVMFLYRENEDDRENVTLDIQKHRNGPLRRLNLFFKGDRIRFFSADRKQSAASAPKSSPASKPAKTIPAPSSKSQA